MSNTTLKPCPFCGGGGVMNDATWGGDMGFECFTCKADISFDRGGDDVVSITAWNTRPTEVTAFQSGVEAGLRRAAQVDIEDVKLHAGEFTRGELKVLRQAIAGMRAAIRSIHPTTVRMKS